MLEATRVAALFAFSPSGDYIMQGRFEQVTLLIVFITAHIECDLLGYDITSLCFSMRINNLIARLKDIISIFFVCGLQFSVHLA